MPTTLRRAVDVVCAASVLGLIGGVIFYNRSDFQERQAVSGAASELQRFRQIIDYHAASGGDNNARGWPMTIDPQWFGTDPPRNALVTPDRPWVEIASPEEAGLSDPEVRMAVGPQLASFWYNPYQGIVRARVPVAINDRRALEMYNQINNTRLDSIYAPARSPKAALAQTPAPAPTVAAAPPPPEPDLDPTKPKH